jgi:hypothetical protein
MKPILYVILALFALSGCAEKETIADLSQNTAAPMSSYTLKETPAATDSFLIVDSEASNATKRVTIGSLPGVDASATITWTGDHTFQGR